MTLPAYTSLTAFVAHWRALRALAARAPEQSAQLAEMDRLAGELSPGERGALESGESTGELARHRQRAERRLIHVLTQKGILSG